MTPLSYHSSNLSLIGLETMQLLVDKPRPLLNLESFETRSFETSSTVGPLL